MTFLAMYLGAMIVLALASVILLVLGLVGFVRQKAKPTPDILDELITEGQYSPLPQTEENQ